MLGHRKGYHFQKSIDQDLVSDKMWRAAAAVYVDQNRFVEGIAVDIRKKTALNDACKKCYDALTDLGYVDVVQRVEKVMYIHALFICQNFPMYVCSQSLGANTRCHGLVVWPSSVWWAGYIRQMRSSGHVDWKRTLSIGGFTSAPVGQTPNVSVLVDREYSFSFFECWDSLNFHSFFPFPILSYL